MTDRQIVQPYEGIQDVDILLTNKNAMVGLGYALQAILGTGTLVDGLACIPTTPASLGVLVGTGSIYGLQNTDNTAYGTVAADTANPLVKQGIVVGSTAFSCPAPATAGQSRVYLVQAQYQDVDAGTLSEPFVNSSNGTQYFQTVNTVRKGVCVLAIKAGVAATTGTQATPAPDAGYTGLYAITVANGQATITSGNIAPIPGAPFVPSTLAALPANIQNNAWAYFADSGSANAYVIAPVPAIPPYRAGQKFAFKTPNANTGPSTLDCGQGAKSIVRRDGTPLMPNDIPAGSISEAEYDGTNFQLLSASPLHAGSSLVFSTGTSTVADGLTRYFGQNHIVSAYEADVTFKVPFAVRVSRLYGYVPSAATGSRAYTLRKNGFDTALTATCSGPATTATDLAHAVDFAAGDEISVKLATSGGSDVAIHKAVVMIERLG